MIKNIIETAYIIAHLGPAIQAARRQFQVRLDSGTPPPGSTIEDFSDMSLPDAMRAMQASAPKSSGGVPFDAWSSEDQARMQRGELPQGHPEHPNV